MTLATEGKGASSPALALSFRVERAFADFEGVWSVPPSLGAKVTFEGNDPSGGELLSFRRG